jgi:hypothetical protein
MYFSLCYSELTVVNIAECLYVRPFDDDKTAIQYANIRYLVNVREEL